MVQETNVLTNFSGDAKATAIIPAFVGTTSDVMTDLAGQLAPRSVRIYTSDVRYFLAWLDAQNIFGIGNCTRSNFIQYRQHLQEKYAKATASRMLTIARRMLGEAVSRGMLATSPAANVKGFKAGENETPHTALSTDQARKLLAAIKTATVLGKRDYALISLLLRTGMRRSEVAALTLNDLKLEQGHHTATIRHGKGDKRRKSKIPVDVMRFISNYLEAANRKHLAGTDAPLFVQFRRGDKPTEAALGDKSIETIVKARAAAVGIAGLTPHGLRASFVTLALEGGASLHQVQYAAGHADPRTTERYQKRKLNLDNNAVDFIRL